jgi:hypothetical protein
MDLVFSPAGELAPPTVRDLDPPRFARSLRPSLFYIPPQPPVPRLVDTCVSFCPTPIPPSAPASREIGWNCTATLESVRVPVPCSSRPAPSVSVVTVVGGRGWWGWLRDVIVELGW